MGQDLRRHRGAGCIGATVFDLRTAPVPANVTAEVWVATLPAKFASGWRLPEAGLEHVLALPRIQGTERQEAGQAERRKPRIAAERQEEQRPG